MKNTKEEFSSTKNNVIAFVIFLWGCLWLNNEAIGQIMHPSSKLSIAPAAIDIKYAPDSKTLCAATVIESDLHLYSVADNGTLTSIQKIKTDKDGFGINMLAYSPDGSHLAFTHLAAIRKVKIYKVEPDGGLSKDDVQVLSPPAGSNYARFIYSPRGNLAALIERKNTGTTAKVLIFTVDKNGIINPQPTSSYISSSGIHDIAYSKNGTSLTVLEKPSRKSTSTLRMFNIDQDNKISPVVKQVVYLSNNAVAMLYNPNGSNLLVTGSNNSLSVYAIDSTGLHAFIPIPSGQIHGADSFTFSADGKYLAGASLSDHKIYFYKFEADGQLKDIPSQTVQAAAELPVSLAFSPDNKFFVNSFFEKDYIATYTLISHISDL